MPNVVKYEMEYYKTLGYNSRQALSIAWALYFESKDAELEVKYQGNVSSGRRYDCYCKTCGKANQFGAAMSMYEFIKLHKDHDTKTMVVK